MVGFCVLEVDMCLLEVGMRSILDIEPSREYKKCPSQLPYRDLGLLVATLPKFELDCESTTGM